MHHLTLKDGPCEQISSLVNERQLVTHSGDQAFALGQIISAGVMLLALGEAVAADNVKLHVPQG